MQACSKMLLNCLVFPTQQAWKYYIALGCDKVNLTRLIDANQEFILFVSLVIRA